MLVKTALGIQIANATGIQRGVSYFVENVLSVVPQQIMPDKVDWHSTATFFSEHWTQLLVTRRAGFY